MNAFLTAIGYVVICLIVTVALMMIVSTYFTVNELSKKIEALDTEVYLLKCHIKRKNKKKDKKNKEE